MVFVGGPRQVGKTTVALSLLGSAADESSPAYLNWDHSLRAIARAPTARDFRRDSQVRVLPFPTFCRELSLP